MKHQDFKFDTDADLEVALDEFEPDLDDFKKPKAKPTRDLRRDDRQHRKEKYDFNS